MIRIIIIRHGRTAWNVKDGQGRRFRGLVDLPLSDDGVAQAQTTAGRLAGWPLAAIYTSPLQRAVRTARTIAEPHGLVSETLSGLGSMSYGDWAGKTDGEVAHLWPDLYRRWRQNPFSIRVPGGDSAVDLRDRAIAALYDALGRHSDGETIALVSHQIVTRTLVCTLAGMPDMAWWRFRQDLCNLSSFDYDPASGQFTLVALNDTCHLSPALPRARRDGARLLLIRHGQTAWNVGAGEERFRGRTDLPLNNTGRDQARAVAGRLEQESIAAIYTSPLLRARQTVEPLAGKLGLPVQSHDGLLDIDYGRFQGLTHAQAARADPDRYASWRSTPGSVRFPGGEGLADVQSRLIALLDELSVRHHGQTVALAGHQIVNKVLVCTLLEVELDQIWRVEQDTASIDVFQSSDGVWNSLCLNNTCHLE